MRVFSSAFHEGDPIPVKYTCDGENVSPPLEWDGIPEGARTLAIIVDDPDAPSGAFVHWIVCDIPATESGLTEGIGVAAPRVGGGIQGSNGFGGTSYGGPCPPSGTHRYYFRVYALDTVLGLAPGATRQELDSAIRGHIVGEAHLMGRYTRSGRK